jgi:uncharacterized protein (TIGR03086 family)
MDPREFDRRVLAEIDRILAAVTPRHLDLDTPCAGWTVADLLRHMVGHHRGFAAAAEGKPVDPPLWDEVTLDEHDPAGTYLEAAQQVTGAFMRLPDLDQPMAIHGYGTFPARIALNMHGVDFLGHGWDVARAIGVADQLDDALCEHALVLGGRWPDTPEVFGGPGAPFATRVPVEAGEPAYRRLMGFLGRQPGWVAS